MSSPTKNKFHCWVCDGNGDLYCSPDIFGTSTASISRNDKSWKKVGEKFGSVAAGYSGLVCGIKGGSLYLRVGVTGRQPAGTAWEDCKCDAAKVLVGTRCIARQTATEAWYFTGGLLIEGVFDWKAVGLLTDGSIPGEEPPFLSHYTINCRDHLYAITGSNQVVFCNLTTASEVQWSWVADPFFAKSSRIMQWVTSKLWKEDSISGTASSADSNLWCLSDNSMEIWQLVVSRLESKVSCNWNHYALPLKRSEVVMFEACKVMRDRLYFVMKQASKKKCRLVLVALESGSDDRQLVDIPYPGTGPCKALATSRLPVMVAEKECCDDGTCDSCASLKRPLDKGGKENLNGGGPSSLSSELSTPQPKKRKVEFHNPLVSGVKVKYKLSSKIKQVSVMLSCGLAGLEKKVLVVVVFVSVSPRKN